MWIVTSRGGVGAGSPLSQRKADASLREVIAKSIFLSTIESKIKTTLPAISNSEMIISLFGGPIDFGHAGNSHAQQHFGRRTHALLVRTAKSAVKPVA